MGLVMSYYETIVARINYGDDVSRDEAWNALNYKVADMVSDDTISEEEGESILDRATQLDDLGLVSMLEDVGDRRLI